MMKSVSKFCQAKEQDGPMKEGVNWIAQQVTMKDKNFECKSGASTLLMSASAVLIAATLM